MASKKATYQVVLKKIGYLLQTFRQQRHHSTTYENGDDVLQMGEWLRVDSQKCVNNDHLRSWVDFLQNHICQPKFIADL